MVTAFRETGQRYSYFGRLIDGRLVAVIDGRLVGPFTKMGNSPVFSPDGQHYAFAAAIEDGKWVVIRDGSYDPATSFQGIGPILFSKDGSRLIFAASTTGNNWVVSDNDCISASYLGINGIGFLGNGIVSYLAEKTTGMLLVVNGKEFPVRGSLVYSNVVKNA